MKNYFKKMDRMTQEEKQLLLKDLCARLPYDTIISVNNGKYREDVKLHPHYIFDWDAERWDAKPYLRPMLSMTADEYNEFSDVANMTIYEDGKIITNGRDIDWLCKHHFDFRDLIEKGLALEAPEDMYNI